MTGGPNKLSLTKAQFTRFIKAKTAGTGVQLTFAQAAVNDMIKSGEILPLAALVSIVIPALKALGLGAAGAVGSNLIGKIFGKGY